MKKGKLKLEKFQILTLKNLTSIKGGSDNENSVLYADPTGPIKTSISNIVYDNPQ